MLPVGACAASALKLWAQSCIRRADGRAATLFPRSLSSLVQVAPEPVCLIQLDSLCRQPSAERLESSVEFLHTQLPRRLHNQALALRQLETRSAFGRPIIDQFVADSLAAGADFESSARRGAYDNDAALEEFASQLEAFRTRVEEAMMMFCTAWQDKADGWGFFRNGANVDDMNHSLDLNHWYLLSLRVMTAQHLAAWQLYRGDHPPGQNSLVHAKCPMLRLVRLVTENCRAFCIEKNSAAPEVHVTGDDTLSATVLDTYVEFLLSEVLKNAMQAEVRRHGAWNVDEIDPMTIDVHAEPGTQYFQIKVTDQGGGIPAGDMWKVLSYYHSAVSRGVVSYGYSRGHGSQFEGIGVGVPLARVYAHFMGGEITWESDMVRGSTSVSIQLPRYDFCF